MATPTAAALEDETPRPERRIRSFVRREGRFTEGQKRALQQLWPRYGIDTGETLLDPVALFGRTAPLTLEIGFGNGDSLRQLAQANPDQDFIGIEVHRPGVGRLLQQLAAESIENVRVMSDDAVEVLRHRIAPATLQRLLLWFPDPWHKKRHHKRRIVQPPFLALVQERLAPGGLLHMATDWSSYAEQMVAVSAQIPGLCNDAAASGGYTPRPAWRPRTHFEQRGERLGHGVWDIVVRRCDR